MYELTDSDIREGFLVTNTVSADLIEDWLELRTHFVNIIYFDAKD